MKRSQSTINSKKWNSRGIPSPTTNNINGSICRSSGVQSEQLQPTYTDSKQTNIPLHLRGQKTTSWSNTALNFGGFLWLKRDLACPQSVPRFCISGSMHYWDFPHNLCQHKAHAQTNRNKEKLDETTVDEGTGVTIVRAKDEVKAANRTSKEDAN